MAACEITLLQSFLRTSDHHLKPFCCQIQQFLIKAAEEKIKEIQKAVKMIRVSLIDH